MSKCPACGSEFNEFGLLSIEELAHYLKRSPATIREHMKLGKINFRLMMVGHKVVRVVDMNEARRIQDKIAGFPAEVSGIVQRAWRWRQRNGSMGGNKTALLRRSKSQPPKSEK
jgi:hypothetical protein